MKYQIGDVLEFEYNLINHPSEWCYYKGIVLKQNDMFIWVWCLTNEHVGVFTKSNPWRKVKKCNK